MNQETALALPDEDHFKSDIQAINKFQQIVRQTMLEGHDYGVIPGTGNKPTLLKPGAEKIAKLLGLSDQYEILDRQEDWSKPFFRYLVKCSLCHVSSGVVVSEGLGECNSMESKYRWRWVFPDDVPTGIDKDTLGKKTGKRRDGKGTYTQYRLENDDIYSQVNTLIKMAKKRALVDASLSAGRLSDVFTQDIEDMRDEEPKAEKVEPPKQASTPSEGPKEITPEDLPLKQDNTDIIQYDFDADWLKEALTKVKWSDVTVKSYLKNTCKVDTDGTVVDVVARLTKEQRAKFFEELQGQTKKLL